jgi:hypothetical protein
MDLLISESTKQEQDSLREPCWLQMKEVT